MTNPEIVEQAYGHFRARELPQMLALIENDLARLAADWEIWEVRPETMVGDGDRFAGAELVCDNAVLNAARPGR